MSAKIVLLRAKNNSIFARLTKLNDLAQKVPISTADLRSAETFMAETETLEVIRKEFISNLDSINELSIEKDPEFIPSYQALDAFEDIYARIQRVRSRITAPRTTDQNKGAHTPVKLPPINIPSFDGRMDNWPIFYESFKANIHTNTSLSDAQRIQYLIGKLTGPALKIISGIIPSGENYLSIWESLVKKYQDKRALGCHYMSILFNIKPTMNNSASLNTFVETFDAAISALEQLKLDDLKDFIFLYTAMRKIDAATAQAFESSIRDKDIPSYKDFIEFTKSQVKILERTAPSSSQCNRSPASVEHHPNNNAKSMRTLRSRNSYQSQTFLTSDDRSNKPCSMCNKSDHQQVYKCPAFKSLPAKGRLDFIKSKRGCVNCLSLSHTVTQCNSTYSCRSCQKPHHTLLHLGSNNNNNSTSQQQPPPTPYTSNTASTTISWSRSHPQASDKPSDGQNITQPNVSLCAQARLNETQFHSTNYGTNSPRSIVLLSTAKVNVLNNNKQNIAVRCLIDNASQNNLITSACCEQLILKPISLSNSFIKGIGSASQTVRGYVQLLVTSKDKKYSYNITALVVDNITDRMPSEYVDTSIVQHLVDLPLADPHWHIPGEVELILGAQLFPHLLLGGRVVAPPAPSAIETVFGYVLMGDAPTVNSNFKQNNAGVSALKNINTATFFTCSGDVEISDRSDDLRLDKTLTKFWEMEEMPSKGFLSPEENQCEEIYKSTISRDDTGRYCTTLPFYRDPSELGDSRSVAVRRLHSLERKLQDPELRSSYNEVVQGYIDNDYLSEVSPDCEDYSQGYFIPHFAVIRRDKETTKVRIVLDASAKCHNGVSLNDILHAGPNLQADIFVLLLNFRLFEIAMAADIKQMYLRILLKSEHRKYQKILFRFHPSQPVREYQFNRVAFGLKCSPFLAMRTVRQLAIDERDRFPLAADVASHELYMDDLTTSVPTVGEGEALSRELIDLFNAGGFSLTKWASNSPELLASVPQSNRAAIEFSDNENMKILGLKWLPAQDIFTFSTSPIKETFTKRTILSSIARLWDVLGFAAPVILFAKLLIKELWLLKVDWDDPLPDNIHSLFRTFNEQLPLLSACSIPRHSGVRRDCCTNIVAFADASLKAYGCVVYLHVTDSEGNVRVTLICAKSKVAPVKVVSLARLELCAAVLMSRLVRLIGDTYSARTKIDNIFAFSDSKIALSWINSLPHRWDIYVSNRVAKCQENLDPRHFYHVSGIENPSDCLSRGLLPEQLLSHPLWWNGPSWLCAPVTNWPITPFIPEDWEKLPEFKSKTLLCSASNTATPGILHDLAKKYSSWNKILRIITYILKFTRIIPRNNNHISASQLIIAERYLVRDVQRVHFPQLVIDLKTNKAVPTPLRKLDLFIDEHGIIRVGGRLSNSNLPYEAQHPALLPKHDHVTHLLIDYYHRVHSHTGANVLSSLLRQKYWILASRNVIRQRVHACNACFRNSPSHLNTKMADLPPYRVQETKAFVHTGVDCAGPINITLCRRRGQRSIKSYICLFICLVTKAVHIELATDLSTDAFLSAFKRFISRRGPVTHMYSDNGTNFVGAKSQINELLTDHRIEWHMIPPRAPHFGGLWESNIKSIKLHLYRVIGSQLLTYEELLTVLIQIETLLNSRPLCVLTEDPYPEPLTPAHFIMASPLTYLPTLPISEETKTLRHRKELLDQMVNSYWKKWRLEYLNSLQVRQKWLNNTDNVLPGTIVLMHQDDVPPLRWPLGIIQEVYPGKDGRVRVVLVKTALGMFRRPVVKICPLPSQ